MKPLAGFVGYNSEWRELAQVISRVSKKTDLLLLLYLELISKYHDRIFICKIRTSNGMI